MHLQTQSLPPLPLKIPLSHQMAQNSTEAQVCPESFLDQERVRRVSGQPGSGHSAAKHGVRYTLTFAHEAPDVEVLVLHTQHLSLAHIPTGITQDRSAGRLLQRGMSSLGLRHWGEWSQVKMGGTQGRKSKQKAFQHAPTHRAGHMVVIHPLLPSAIK